MRLLRSIVVFSTAVLAMAGVGCSSNSNQSTSAQASSSSSAGSSGSTSYPAGKEQVCQARDQLKTSLDALIDPSLLAGGTSAITAAVDKVQSSLAALKTAAKQNYKPEVDALQTSLQQLQSAVGNLGNGNVSQSLQAVGSAIAKVGTTSGDLFTKLKAACGS
jgi:cytochrome c556